MNRSALWKLFRQLIAASLPLSAIGCATQLVAPADAAVAQCQIDLWRQPCQVQPYLVLTNGAASSCATLCEQGPGVTCQPVQTSCGPGVICPPNCAVGRRPAGLVAARSEGGDPGARLLAEQAHLEAASVHAFRALGRDLRRHAAPLSLVRAAARSARDEIRHARITGALARSRGGSPARVRIAPSAPRDLEQLATENAVEGTVRETYGALVATWQARAAGDEALRTAMAAIAIDETRHAELAWAIHRFAGQRLPRAAFRRVEHARRAAASALIEELRAEPPAECVVEAGLPPAAHALALAQGLAAALA